jgi:acyl-CoA oxidase
MYRNTEYIFNVIGVNLNTAAFLHNIELLGNDEQVKKWRNLILEGKIFGGYGQTELGHGSNVQGL